MKVYEMSSLIYSVFDIKLMVFLYCTLLDYCFPSDVSDREHGIKYVTGGKNKKDMLD